MALILAGERDTAVLEPAIKVLQDRQMEDGNWPREGAGGVFFNTSMLHYDMYRTYFPIWALQLADTANATNKLP
jgi:squalene cyclase